jgi:hypothetical protein
VPDRVLPPPVGSDSRTQSEGGCPRRTSHLELMTDDPQRDRSLTRPVELPSRRIIGDRDVEHGEVAADHVVLAEGPQAQLAPVRMPPCLVEVDAGQSTPFTVGSSNRVPPSVVTRRLHAPSEAASPGASTALYCPRGRSSPEPSPQVHSPRAVGHVVELEAETGRGDAGWPDLGVLTKGSLPAGPATAGPARHSPKRVCGRWAGVPPTAGSVRQDGNVICPTG